MTTMLLGQIIVYALLLLLALRLTYLIVTAGFNLAVVILTPFLFITVVAVSLATYPVVLLLRLFGFNARSFYTVALESWFKINEVQRPTVDVSSMWESHGKYTYAQEEFKPQYEAPPPPPPVEPQAALAFDPWQILGIPRHANQQMITAAYRQKMMMNHPDKLAALDPELQALATQRTILIKQAYDILNK